MPHSQPQQTTHPLPVIVRDPRYIAGRATVGQRAAVDVFSTLLQEAIRTYGNEETDGATSKTIIETAPAYYEYGNALLRYALRQQQEETVVSPKKSAAELREAAAAAAERRAQLMNGSVIQEKLKDLPTSTDNDKAKVSNEEEKEESDTDDIQLALEMMETAWAILDVHNPSSSDESETREPSKYQNWIMEQLPRVLTGIGDTLSALDRHADAVDAYLRALEHRQSALDHCLAESPHDAPPTNREDMEKQLKLMKHRRQVVEVTILLVEELLFCGNDQDVVTSETQVVLVSQGNVIDYARGYYDRARDELQETVLLLGQLAAVTATYPSAIQKMVQEEKENICFVATMVMGAGTTLAELDDQLADASGTADVPSNKKPRV